MNKYLDEFIWGYQGLCGKSGYLMVIQCNLLVHSSTSGFLGKDMADSFICFVKNGEFTRCKCLSCLLLGGVWKHVLFFTPTWGDDKID